MTFQNRLIRIYTIFMLLMSIVVGLFFYHYSFKKQTLSESKSLASSSMRTESSIIDIFSKMEYRTKTLLADPNILIDFKKLSNIENFSKLQISQIKFDISNSLIIDSVLSTFYRILIYNKDYVISTQQYLSPPPKSTFDISKIPNIKEIDENNGQPLIITNHEDNWSSKDTNGDMVFSLVRKVVGDNMGYIEVQELTSDLKYSIDISNNKYKTLIFVNNNEYLYGNADNIESKYYKDFLSNDSLFININGVKYMKKTTHSDKFGITVITFISYDDMKESSHYLIFLVISMVTLFIITSSLFVVISSKILTKPIKQICKIMEKTTKANSSEDIKIDTDLDEIKYLAETYQRLLARLDYSLEKEKKLIKLNAESQLNMLQSQINPHFIYNILNVISAKGFENEDETICDICGYLANLLRYSTNTKTNIATIKEEISYVNTYLILQKARYENILNFTIFLDPEIQNESIPKIVLQQFVENSFNHGFRDKTDNLEIHIDAKKIDNRVVIEIEDNGSPITTNKLDSLNVKLEKVKTLILNNENLNLEIGGMGLSNTYARLLLLKKKELKFLIFNNDIEGVSIRIEFKID